MYVKYSCILYFISPRVCWKIFLYIWKKISLFSLIYSSCTSLDFHFLLFNLSLNICFILNANSAAEEKGHIGWKANRAKKRIVTVINHLTRKRRGISDKEIREETRISRGRREESRWQPKTFLRDGDLVDVEERRKTSARSRRRGGARGAAIGRAGRRGSHDGEANGFRAAPRHFVADSRLVRVSPAEQNCARRSPHDLSSSLLVRCCQGESQMILYLAIVPDRRLDFVASVDSRKRLVDLRGSTSPSPRETG